LAVGLLGATIAIGLEAFETHSQAMQMRSQISELRQAIAAEQARRQASSPPPPYLEDARRIVAIASMPVDGILRSIERVRIPGVRVLTLDIQAVSGQVRLEIEANDLGQVSQVLDELNAGHEVPRWAWSTTRGEPAPRPRVVATLESSWRDGQR